MKIIRTKATINGVETTMLFTPRLFEFKTPSMDFTNGSDSGKVVAMYADLAYCAALNYWTLTDKDINDYPLTRVDYHEWAVLEPPAFSKMMRIALEALTDKSLEDHIKEANNSNECANKDTNEDVKKKISSSIMGKLKRFWSANAE